MIQEAITAKEQRAKSIVPEAYYRCRFISRVGTQLDRAGVNYVVLHSYDGSRPVDSDLDLAVTRESRDTVDALLRSGALGSLVQCLHYDVPWCRYYVVRADEPGRRYRAIDVACDPWGIGRYGHALPVALQRAQSPDGLRTPDPAAEVVYLVAKRARKGVRDAEDVRALATAYRSDPRRSRELLESCFGRPAQRVAAALENGGTGIRSSLEEIDSSIRRSRVSASALARRVLFGPTRALRRVGSPSGLWVCVAGPDGVGKSTLGEELGRVTGGPFRRTVRLGQRRGYLPSPGRLLGRPVRESTRPHARTPSGAAGSLARILYFSLDAALGWLPRIAVARVRSTLVVTERGWLDLAVDPQRYRVSAWSGLVRHLARVLPQPDLTLVLEAPPELIHQRKPELSADEIRRQLDAWQQLAGRRPQRFAAVDATREPREVLDDALSKIDTALAARHVRFEGARLALDCLGPMNPDGQSFAFMPAAGEVRWLVPARGARGPLGARVYRPTRKTALVKSLALELAHRAGAARLGPTVSLDTSQGLAPVLAARLGYREVELSAAATGGDKRGGRALLAVWANNSLVAFAKVGEDGASLQREEAILEVLADAQPRVIVAPRYLGRFDWNGRAVLVLEPVAAQLRTVTSIGRPELEALTELGSLNALSRALRAEDGLIPVHGDFAPWNCARLEDGRLALWDWEEARAGFALEDLFHWRMQRFSLLRRGVAADLVRGALEPDAQVLNLCERLGAEPSVAPLALRAVLERALLHSEYPEPSARRREALKLLETSS